MGAFHGFTDHGFTFSKFSFQPRFFFGGSWYSNSVLYSEFEGYRYSVLKTASKPLQVRGLASAEHNHRSVQNTLSFPAVGMTRHILQHGGIVTVATVVSRFNAKAMDARCALLVTMRASLQRNMTFYSFCDVQVRPQTSLSD